MKQIEDFFKEQNIYNEEFFKYIKDKVHVYPNNIEYSWFGCFPKVENDILVDMVLSVPEIITEQDLLVNLHEFYHAYELFNELGTIYIENRKTREENATNFEKKYIKKPI